MSDRLIKSNEVLQMCGGIHAVTLARWIKDASFPAPYMVVGRIRYWKEDDVIAWWGAQK